MAERKAIVGDKIVFFDIDVLRKIKMK